MKRAVPSNPFGGPQVVASRRPRRKAAPVDPPEMPAALAPAFSADLAATLAAADELPVADIIAAPIVADELPDAAADVIEWVGDDADRARFALDAENARNRGARKSVLAHIATLIDATA